MPALLFIACSSEPDSTAAGADAVDGGGVDDTVQAPEESSDSTPADDEVEPTEQDESAITPMALSSSDRLDSYTLSDDEFGTMVTVTVDGSTRTIETNALPDHETGEFPNDGNPSTISAQDLTWEFPVSPAFTGEATDVRTPGVAVNGVKFEPGTAETVTCSSGEMYRVEGLQDVYNLGMDFNNAHVQPTGEYHYHGISQLLADAYAADDDLVHVGFASDGYLVYYSKSAAYSSSHVLDTEPRAGTDCSGSGAIEQAGVTDIEVEGTTPDGTYTSDWIYTEGAGDLDRCNGITINGQYAYLITDTFPYISRCLNGEVSGADVAAGPAVGGGAGGEGAPGGAAPDLTDAAAALGVTAEELQAALGGPPPWDLEQVAATLGVSTAQLEAVLGAGAGS